MRYNSPATKEFYWKDKTYRVGDMVKNLSSVDYDILTNAHCVMNVNYDAVLDDEIETQMSEAPENRMVKRGRPRIQETI